MTYDLHIHSCLSPCGDNDMTVNNIVNMAALKELDVIALTDHNSSKNCPAFMKVAEEAGIKAIPGMEINTAEEIHAVSGIARTMPMLAEMPLIVSSETNAVENRWGNVRLRAYRKRISENSLPRKARMSVFVIVPTMSWPMFMPERNSSLCERDGFAACTSSRADEMLIATSITAPSALMMMLAVSSPLSPSVRP